MSVAIFRNERQNIVKTFIELIVKSPIKLGLNIVIFSGLVVIFVPQIHNSFEGVYTAANFLNRVRAWLPNPLATAPTLKQTQFKGLTKEQSTNATAIVNKGRAIGMSDRDIKIALMVAMQESTLKGASDPNHRDDWFWKQHFGKPSESRGLFQQINSWGFEKCRLNASCSAGLFYNALKNVKDRNNKELWQVAAEVQRPAKEYERHYQQWERQSTNILKDTGNLKISESVKFPEFKFPNIGAIFGAKEASKSDSKKVTKLSDSDKQVPQKGDTVGGYTITSGWGHRDTGIAGASTFHRGIDLGTPMGTPLYMIGSSKSVAVKCWTDNNGGGLVATFKTDGFQFDYLHLSNCIEGTYDPGQQIAESGDSGVGSAHAHVQMRPIGGERFPPYRYYVEKSLKPQ